MIDLKEDICPYCKQYNALDKEAIFCSQNHEINPEMENNLFYASGSSVVGSEHTSRYTFRFAFNGYQHYEIDGTERTLKPDSTLFISQGQEFNTETISGDVIELMTVSLKESYLKDIYRNLILSEGQLLENPQAEVDIPRDTLLIEKDVGLFPLLHQLKFQVWDPNKKERLNRYVPDLATHFFAIDRRIRKELIKKMDPVRYTTRVELNRRMMIVKDYLLSHLTLPLSLTQLSRELGMSKFHLVRSFRKWMGISPLKYLQKERMKYALWLLKNTSLGVTEVSGIVCYDTPSAFSRAFKKEMRHSPSSYCN